MEAVLSGTTGRTTLGPAALTVGRATTNQMVINDTKASSRHAEIRPHEQGYSITDLGSTNGTFINEQRLAPNTPRPLNTGDVIRIGDTTFTYEVIGAPPISPTVVAHDGSGAAPIAPTVIANQGSGAAPISPTVFANPGQNVEPGYQATVAAPPPTFYAANQQQGQPPLQAPPPAYPPPPYIPPTPSQSPYTPPSYMPQQPGVYAPPPMPGYVPPAQKRNNRTLWITLGIVGGVLLISIIACVAFYSSLSTPTKTLATYCNALKNRDYQTAYDQLTQSNKDALTEQQFATFYQNVTINNCTVSNVNDNGSTATGVIDYVVNGDKTTTADYTLVNVNNSWKISTEKSRR